MAATELTWHMGPGGDRRTDPVPLVDHAQSAIYYATAQDVTEAGRWTLVRFDVYECGRTYPFRLGESGTMADCRRAAQDDLATMTTA